jgi:hypothetical protein
MWTIQYHVEGLQMNHLLIIAVEVVIYMAWIMVVLSRLRRQSLAAMEELLVIFFAMPLVVIMELKNEYLYVNTGVYYPFSLFYFPGFKFPLAIIFSSSLFAWVLYVLACSLSSRFAPQGTQANGLLQLGFFLILISANIVTEWSGVWLGYWYWHKIPRQTLNLQLAKYIFYFWFTFPPVLAAKFFSWQMKNIMYGQNLQKASD